MSLGCGRMVRSAGRARARPAGTSSAITSVPQMRRVITISPPAVLALVVGAELAGLQRLPPRDVLAIPAHGRLQRRGERIARRPAELPDLRRIQGVATIVAGPVDHGLDEAVGLVEQAQDLARDREIGDLVATADVVDLAVAALPQ